MKEIINKYANETFYNMGNYSRFTIDLVSDLEDDYNEDDVPENVLKGDTLYKIKNALEVIKHGNDKDLLEKLKSDLENLN